MAYFFGEMHDCRNPIEFVFNLSAFLSEARATTWVLDEEYSNSEYRAEFRRWYGDTSGEEIAEGTVPWQMEHSDHFQYMNALRNRAVNGKPQSPTEQSVEAMRYGVSQGTANGEFRIDPPAKIEEAASTRIRLRIDSDDDGLRQSLSPGNDEVELYGQYDFSDAPEPFDSISIQELTNCYYDRLYEILYDWEKFVMGEYDFDRIDKDYRLDPSTLYDDP